jgi:hypothetical protein
MVLTPEYPYDPHVGIRKPKQATATQFERRVFASYRDAEKQGYVATAKLMKLGRDLGAVAAAKQLLSQPGWKEPLERLPQVGALDLSIEAHVLDPRFQHLFPRPRKSRRLASA